MGRELQRQLTTAGGEGRRSTWLELFFDVVFVVAVFRLGHLLRDELSVDGVLAFVGLLTVVWWLWLCFAYLADLFDNDRLPSRLVQLAGMLGALFLAAMLDGGLAHQSARFATVYGSLLTLFCCLYAVAGWVDVAIRQFCWWFSGGFLCGALLWFGSLLVVPPDRYVVWAIALLINAVAAPLAYTRSRRTPSQPSHMPERFGLFTIVVLGDVILEVASGIAETGWTAASVTVGLAGFVVAGCVWWLYFLVVFESETATRILRADRRRIVRSFFYSYGHLPLYASIVAAGVGFEVAADVDVSHGKISAGALLSGSQVGLAAGFALTIYGAGRRFRRGGMAALAAVLFSAVVTALTGLPPPVLAVAYAVGGVALVTVAETARRRGARIAADVREGADRR